MARPLTSLIASLATGLFAGLIAVSAIALGLTLGGCSGAPATAEPPPEPLTTHMHRHMAHALALRDVVIGGELSLLGHPANALGQHDQHAELPPSAAPFVEKMNHAARRAGDAQTLADAAQAVAEVAASCGACHAAHGAKLTPMTPTQPPVEGDVRGHMQRHHWAAARMFDGLIRPDWNDWKDGANTLSEVSLFEEHLAASGATPGTQALAEKVHALGQRALDATPEARATVYGELIASCAGCHNRVEP